MNEVTELCKEGVSNVLKSLNLKPKINKTIKGYSGNKYTVNISASEASRFLIVDQTLISAELLIPWLKAQLPKTFESYKATIADFFKYLDICLEFQKKQKPVVYWFHNYEVPRELTETIGFSLEKILKEIIIAIGKSEGITEEELKKEMQEMLSDEEIKSILNIFDTTIADFMGILQKGIPISSPTTEVNITRTANRFHIPFISTSVLDMMEAGILNPKYPSEARYLRGLSMELGVVDFLNPPWSDYVLRAAYSEKGRITFDEFSNILRAGKMIGHPPESALGISTKKVINDPTEGVETLEQNDLVVVEEKETIKLTDKGKEIIRQIRKRPKESAIKKAIDLIKGRVSITLPPFLFKF